jgi:hypothetical protein
VLSERSGHGLRYRRSDARLADNGFATPTGMNESAKVVLEIFQSNRQQINNLNAITSGP